MNTKPRVILIDDQPERALAGLSAIREDVEPLHPQEFVEAHLKGATLVLVDHQLEDKHWSDRQGLPFVGRPMDGLAVASIIRAHLRSAAFELHPPVGIALYSAKLASVAPSFKNPPEHLAAKTADLEWAFNKSDTLSGLTQTQRILEFSEAISRLGKWWQSRDIQDNEQAWKGLENLLGLSAEMDWSQAARLQIERCHPPMHEMAEWTDGLAVIRWFAQRILPYPTFLIDDRQLAIRLGIHPKSFQLALQSDSRLGEALRSARYTGILSSFLGRRWWSTGVDALMWTATQGSPMTLDEVRRWLQSFSEVVLEPCSDEYTLIVGPDTEQLDEIATFEQCVQIQPDDWPPYAKPAWTTIERAKQNARLRTWVTASDIEKIN